MSIRNAVCGDCLYWHNTDDPDESCDSSPCVTTLGTMLQRVRALCRKMRETQND